MRHDTSFDVLKLFDDIEKFLSGIPARLPDTKKQVTDILEKITEITGEE